MDSPRTDNGNTKLRKTNEVGLAYAGNGQPENNGGVWQHKSRCSDNEARHIGDGFTNFYCGVKCFCDREEHIKCC